MWSFSMVIELKKSEGKENDERMNDSKQGKYLIVITVKCT